MATLKMRVRGMTGPQDEERLERAYRAEAGVLGAAANREAECVEVEFEDDEVALDRLLEIAAGAGFSAEVAG